MTGPATDLTLLKADLGVLYPYNLWRNLFRMASSSNLTGVWAPLKQPSYHWRHPLSFWLAEKITSSRSSKKLYYRHVGF